MKPTESNDKVGSFVLRRPASFLAEVTGGSSFSMNRPGVEPSALGRFLFDVGASMASSYGRAVIPATPKHNVGGPRQ